MDIYNRNDIVRQNLTKFMDKCILNGMSIEESAIKYRNILYKLESNNNIDIRNFRNYNICIMYLDALKLSLYNHKNLLVDDNELEFLSILNDIFDEKDLLAEVSFDSALFSKIILYSYKYAKLDNLAKSLVVKSLSDLDNQLMFEKIPYHKLDILTYNKIIVLDDLIDNLEKNIKYQSKHFDMDLDENNVLMITNFVRNLYSLDRDNCLDLVLDIAKKDYAVCKYLINYLEDNMMLDHIDYYENYNLDDIIYRLTTDEVFLKDSLWMIISLYIYKSYDDIELSTDILDNKEVSKVYKKLNLD